MADAQDSEGLKAIIPDSETGGVWRIRKREKAPMVEVFKVEESGHGDILSPDFIEWRTHPPEEDAHPKAIVQE